MANKPIVILSFLQQIRNICSSKDSHRLVMLNGFSRSTTKETLFGNKKAVFYVTKGVIPLKVPPIRFREYLCACPGNEQNSRCNNPRIERFGESPFHIALGLLQFR